MPWLSNYDNDMLGIEVRDHWLSSYGTLDNDVYGVFHRLWLLRGIEISLSLWIPKVKF